MLQPTIKVEESALNLDCNQVEGRRVGALCLPGPHVSQDFKKNTQEISGDTSPVFILSWGLMIKAPRRRMCFNVALTLEGIKWLVPQGSENGHRQPAVIHCKSWGWTARGITTRQEKQVRKSWVSETLKPALPVHLSSSDSKFLPDDSTTGHQVTHVYWSVYSKMFLLSNK